MGNKYFNWVLFGNYPKKWNGSGKEQADKRFAPLLEELRLAQQEWGYANQYFNLVSDPDLVDLAIYYMGVTEKKYLYLLKKAREFGVCGERYSFR
ncbi:MAG: YaaL family protein [Bacillota bacterium]